MISAYLDQIRARFAHVDCCPISGERVFFENAGGALTLKSVLETTSFYAAIPDNQGRTNATSEALMQTIATAKDDIRLWFNAPDGEVFIGESGTELLFRLIRTAICAVGFDKNAEILGSSLEHPATFSAAAHWAKHCGLTHVTIAHDNATGCIADEDYAARITPETRVATIIHTSPVTGMGVDVAAIAAAIRTQAPECLIIVDGIQHASHGLIDIQKYDIDGYVLSGYKVFSRHGYGVAWVSERLIAAGIEQLKDGPVRNWEFGTRDTSAYASTTDIVAYLNWLGDLMQPNAASPRARLEAAACGIHDHEKTLCQALIHGIDNHAGLADMAGIQILGGIDNPAREGLVCFAHKDISSPKIVAHLNAHGVRTHTRKADHYSGAILRPLGLEDAVRVSMCHYNSKAEVARLLEALQNRLYLDR